jgi:uncharacterized protein
MKKVTLPGAQPQGIHIVAKPIGPKCNLDCEYCFYLEKQALFSKGEDYVMSDEVLVAYITKYITLQPTPVVGFVWQGGEPTLLGLDFYKRVVELQRPYADQKEVTNSIQTNGTLLDDDWCEFLKENNFLVGLSLDGPQEIHDRYRKDKGGKGSFDKVMRGMELLKKHGVEFNIMATVGRDTAYKPLEVYRFFKEWGVEFIQFAPVIERVAGADERQLGLKLAGPSTLARNENVAVTEWSVEPEVYGDFLIAVFDEWVRNDVGTTTVMNFEWALNSWIGNTSPVCQFAHSCGKAIMMEHNGDLYACDHSMYPEFRLGNIVQDNPVELAENSVARGFGVKDANLPDSCHDCQVLKACWGGCPKHRFVKPYDNGLDRYYLCEGYRKYFLYIRKYLNGIIQLLENGLPASHIMEACKGPLVINVGERS